jgi:hypothetical protein
MSDVVYCQDHAAVTPHDESPAARLIEMLTCADKDVRHQAIELIDAGAVQNLTNAEQADVRYHAMPTRLALWLDAVAGGARPPDLDLEGPVTQDLARKAGWHYQEEMEHKMGARCHTFWQAQHRPLTYCVTYKIVKVRAASHLCVADVLGCQDAWTNPAGNWRDLPPRLLGDAHNDDLMTQVRENMLRMFEDLCWGSPDFRYIEEINGEQI